MSMISAQIDELRELAGDGSMEWVTGPIRASVLRDAADTIWQLRCRLVDAEDRVRKSGELCKLCEREAENAKLRDLVHDLLQPILADGFDCYGCTYDDCNGMQYTDRCKLLDRACELGVEVE